MILLDTDEFIKILNNQDLMEHLVKIGTKYPQNLSLALAEIIDDISTTYDIDKVIRELRRASGNGYRDVDGDYVPPMIKTENAIEIVKQGGVGKDVE